MPRADPPVVLLGGDVNALSAARSLGRRGIEVSALAESGERRPVASSRFAHRFVPLSDPDPAASWSAWLEAHPIGAVVIPAGDHGLEYVARHRARLAQWGHHPVEASDSLVLRLLDKGATANVAREAGIDAPRVVAVDGRGSVAEILDVLRLPCALKPAQSHRAPSGLAAKGMVVRTADELAAAVADADGALVATEIVPGPDDFCSYYTYFHDGEPLFHFTKRKLRQYPVRWGTGTYHLAEWVPEAQEVGLRLFDAIGLVGLGNVEFKRDERDGKLKLIECNLRLTAADPLVQGCGLDLPHLLYQRALGRQVALPDRFRQGVRQWHPLNDLRALRDYRRAGDLTVPAWAASLLHRQRLPLWAADDPMPSVRHLAGLAGRVARRAHGRRP